MRPLTPASISSNTIVSTGSCPESTLLIASIVRLISPPEAIRASGRSGSPRLGEIRYSTCSAPSDVASHTSSSISTASDDIGCIPGADSRRSCTSKRARSMPSSESDSVVSRLMRSAARFLAVLSARVASAKRRYSSAIRVSTSPMRWSMSASSSMARPSSSRRAMASSIVPYRRTRRLSRPILSCTCSRRIGSASSDARRSERRAATS